MLLQKRSATRLLAVIAVCIGAASCGDDDGADTGGASSTVTTSTAARTTAPPATSTTVAMWGDLVPYLLTQADLGDDWQESYAPGVYGSLGPSTWILPGGLLCADQPEPASTGPRRWLWPVAATYSHVTSTVEAPVFILEAFEPGDPATLQAELANYSAALEACVGTSVEGRTLTSLTGTPTGFRAMQVSEPRNGLRSVTTADFHLQGNLLVLLFHLATYDESTRCGVDGSEDECIVSTAEWDEIVATALARLPSS